MVWIIVHTIQHQKQLCEVVNTKRYTTVLPFHGSLLCYHFDDHDCHHGCVHSHAGLELHTCCEQRGRSREEGKGVKREGERGKKFQYSIFLCCSPFILPHNHNPPFPTHSTLMNTPTHAVINMMFASTSNSCSMHLIIAL